MYRKMLAVVVLCSSAAGAQSVDGGVDVREHALFGTPQKAPSAQDAGVPHPADGQSGPSARPSEDAMFGTTGGQTPEPQGTPADRPSEDDIFGGASTGAEPPATTASEEVREGVPRQEEQGLSGAVQDRFAAGDQVDDPLQIGGLFYQRLSAVNRAGAGFSRTTLSVPTLVDGYFDARPNDRLRAMVVARLRYDATYDETAFASQLVGSPRSNPSITLDQLWLSFDIARQVFVTAGRQHVKWGTGRFWNPTDYLHDTRRDALALFDDRVGTSMVKFQVPFESLNAQFTAIALLETAAQTGTLGQVGAAARAEGSFGDAAVGVDAVVQNGARPKYGADISAGVGPFDLYGELSLRAGPARRFERTDAAVGGVPLFERRQVADFGTSATAGLTYTFAYRENDTATVGAEYFFNPTGYDDTETYPFLLLNGGFQPFYTGRQYAAVYALLLGPGDWDKTSFVLSNLANLSDRSYVSRLDFTVRVLTYLTVEANVSVFYGNPNGEFRLRLAVPGAVIGRPGEVVTVPEQRFSAGLGLRMDI